GLSEVMHRIWCDMASSDDKRRGTDGKRRSKRSRTKRNSEVIKFVDQVLSEVY
ncbi:hypothetical protein Tco_0043663, partial [Tanacetum coccineum]